jgi:hypothetical protein
MRLTTPKRISAIGVRKTRRNKSSKTQNNSNRLPNARNGLITRKPATTLWSVRGEHMPGYNQSLTRDGVPYRVTQLVDVGTVLTSSSGADTFFATAFNLNQLDQVASWQSVFDQYMIEALEVWLIPTYQDTSGGNTNSVVYSTIDYDDSNAPTSLPNMRQIQNCVETTAYEGIHRIWVPHIAITTQNSTGSSTASGSANVAAPWIDSASPAVNHYAFKCAMKASAVTTVLRLVVRYHLAFRNVF